MSYICSVNQFQCMNKTKNKHGICVQNFIPIQGYMTLQNIFNSFIKKYKFYKAVFPIYFAGNYWNSQCVYKEFYYFSQPIWFTDTEVSCKNIR